MEFAGTFGAGKEKGARSVGFGHFGWSWNERLGKQLSDRWQEVVREEPQRPAIFSFV